MKRRYQAPPSNPVQICFCCAGNLISKEWNKIPYQDRMKFTFVPRYINPDANGRLPLRYCPKCEAQRCENMPGRNHHHLFLYVATPNKPGFSEVQLLQVGRVINTANGHRESFRRPTGPSHKSGAPPVQRPRERTTSPQG